MYVKNNSLFALLNAQDDVSETITFVKDNEQLLVWPVEIEFDKTIDYDFVIFKDVNKNISVMDMLEDDRLICEPTDYTFVLVEVIVDSVTYKVDLKNDDQGEFFQVERRKYR
jgi:hypothetical protein